MDTLILLAFKGSLLCSQSLNLAEIQRHQALKVGLVTNKGKEDRFKNEGIRVIKTFLPLRFYRDFFQTLKGSLLHCQETNLVEIRPNLSFYGSPGFLQE